ncbi:hypothetical protein [Bacillus halotolerans]|uniref:hypothetical protein n=1 Tax=Bacillus halotolerans TaxID=260554 RepID=UPI0003A85A67|nr:hypothetical protein [Bacillus halotolerans]MDG3073117.1 hypothetical protein [Bacillus halotolerans]MDL5611633.1 hypothetical protein [Bacillus halotolerans]BDG79503.1 hypothetical protein BSF_12320 [Bacillus subtilis]
MTFTQSVHTLNRAILMRAAGVFAKGAVGFFTLAAYLITKSPYSAEWILIGPFRL